MGLMFQNDKFLRMSRFFFKLHKVQNDFDKCVYFSYGVYDKKEMIALIKLSIPKKLNPERVIYLLWLPQSPLQSK